MLAPLLWKEAAWRGHLADATYLRICWLNSQETILANPWSPLRFMGQIRWQRHRYLTVTTGVQYKLRTWPFSHVHRKLWIDKTRGPWWSYIAHLSKQLCTLTVEVSAKFIALRFLYKFYSPAPQRPCFFSCIMMAWTESWKRITKGTILPYWNRSSSFWQKDF